MSSSLQWEEIPASENARACVIFLHGRGTNGEDLMPLAEAFNFPSLQFVFPHAPMHCPDFPGGRMWFGPTSEGTPGIETSRKLLTTFMDDLIVGRVGGSTQNSGIPAEKIFVIGFSQGAVMALDVGLRFPKRLACIAALSGFLAGPETLQDEKSAASLSVPILLLHGTADQVVKVDGSRRAYNTLSDIGYDVQIKEYEMAHQIIPEEIVLLRNEMIKYLGDNHEDIA